MDIKDLAKETYDQNRSLLDFLFNCNLKKVYGQSNHMEYGLTDQEVQDLLEWWKKQRRQKFTIKIGPGEYGYLTLSRENGDIGFDTGYDGAFWQSNFSEQEIKQLKKRDDIAIDWDKAIIEPVEE